MAGGRLCICFLFAPPPSRFPTSEVLLSGLQALYDRFQAYDTLNKYRKSDLPGVCPTFGAVEGGTLSVCDPPVTPVGTSYPPLSSPLLLLHFPTSSLPSFLHP